MTASAMDAISSKLDFVAAATIGCKCNGKRFDYKFRKMSSPTLPPIRFISDKSCEGFKSPN